MHMTWTTFVQRKAQKTKLNGLDFWRSRLGAKIVALMIAASAVLSVGAASVQLYLSYLQDRDRVLNELTIVEESFKDGLETALWQYNFEQVEVLLDGVFASQDIVYLRLQTSIGDGWELGESAGSDLVLQDFPLTFERDRQADSLGTLRVGLSLEFARQRLWRQFWALLASNFAKSLLGSIAMLLIFDRLAARHLRSLAQQIQMPWLNAETKIEIDRPVTQTADELDEITSALNTTRNQVRAAHHELLSVNARLSEANQEQAEFTYAISHDLKSPANTIAMLIDEFREVQDLNAEGQSILMDMAKTSGHMRQLVDDVLGYSQLVGSEMATERVDLSGLFEEICGDLAADIREAGAEIMVEELPSVLGNRMQLRLLFQNLLSNAVKFRACLRVPLIEVKHQSQPSGLQVTISDNGIGIAKKHRQRVFGMFKRLNAQSSYAGTGLGLTICQRVMSNHNGQIQICDGIDGGTAFRLTFPQEAA